MPHNSERARSVSHAQALARAVFRAVLAAAVAACDDTIEEPGPALDCEHDGVPCTLSDAPLEVLERGEVLGHEVRAMLEAGASTAEATAWLEDQSDVTEVLADDLALVFRIDRGRPVWVLRRAALAHQAGKASAAQNASGASRAAQSRAPQTARASRVVVGTEPDSKRALVLSPFKHEFAQYDEGQAVAQILEGTRGYEGNVTYLENATATRTNVGISQFMGWENYDVIHISTHGSTTCDGTRCETIIQTGDSYGTAEELREITVEGINTIMIEGSERSWLGVGADFFTSQYPGGLENTIVFFNACESFYNHEISQLADAVRGDESVFLGWTDAVLSDHAKQVAIRFYEALSDDGLTVTSARASLGSLLSLTYDSDSKGDTIITSLALTGRQAGGDLRARDVVWIRDPATGAPLSAGGEVSIVGTPEDGEPDAVPYRIRVDGVDPNDDADSFIVNVSIDGVTAAPVSLADGQQTDTYTWEIDGEVQLGFDVIEGQEVTLRAEVELPDQGTSEDEVPITLVGERLVLLFHSVIRTESVATVGTTTGIVTLTGIVEGTVELAAGREAPLHYVSFEWESGSLSGCTVETSTTDGTLTVLESNLSPDSVESGRVLLRPSDIRDTFVVTCLGHTRTITADWWYAGWNVFHSGLFNAADNEFDDENNAWSIEGWSTGADDVVAVKIYEREETREETTAMESTKLQIVRR